MSKCYIGMWGYRSQAASDTSLLFKEQKQIAIEKEFIIFTQPLRPGRKWHTVNFFKRSLTGLNSEFSFSYTSCLTKAEEPSLPYYLPIAGGRIIGLIPFPRVLVRWEMQSVLSRIWTRVTVSISGDDNHYTTGTSKRGLWTVMRPLSRRTCQLSKT